MNDINSFNVDLFIDSLEAVKNSFNADKSGVYCRGHKYLIIDKSGARADHSRKGRASFKQITEIVQKALNEQSLHADKKNKILVGFEVLKKGFEQRYNDSCWIVRLFSSGGCKLKVASELIERHKVFFEQAAVNDLNDGTSLLKDNTSFSNVQQPLQDSVVDFNNNQNIGEAEEDQESPVINVAPVKEENVEGEEKAISQVEASHSMIPKDEILSMLAEKGIAQDVSEWLYHETALDDSAIASILRFCQRSDKEFPSGGAVFVEKGFLGNDGSWIESGWHDQVHISGQSAPQGEEGAFQETSKKVLGVLSTIPRLDGSFPKGILSIPAFSNGHGRLDFDEEMVTMWDPIFNEMTTYRNSEFAFQYQKFVCIYENAKAKNDSKRMKTIKEAASNVLNSDKFKTENPNACQEVGQASCCPIEGYGEDGTIKGEAAEWEQIKFDKMDLVVEAKLKSRPDLVIKLLLTNKEDRLTFIKNDAIWGAGEDGNGLDALAGSYERLREKLRCYDTTQFKEWMASPKPAPKPQLAKIDLIDKMNVLWRRAKVSSRVNDFLERFIASSLSNQEILNFLKFKKVELDTFLKIIIDIRGGDKQFWEEKYELTECPTKIESISKISEFVTLDRDPIDCMITINGHGCYSDKLFEVPENMWVLAPHPQGFESKYTLKMEKALEPQIYSGSDQFLTPTSGGWRLYGPGEMVNNVLIGPWNESPDKEDEFQKWKTNFPEDVSYIKDTENVPPFGIVPARDEEKEKITYRGHETKKVKVFETTNLGTIVQHLRSANPDEPIVVLPLVCNSDNSSRQEVIFKKAETNLEKLFSPPVKANGLQTKKLPAKDNTMSGKKKSSKPKTKGLLCQGKKSSQKKK
jgi:predicted NAD-dependent protein-ADP-ribosyltransferase YbiA (DUF1768 family)